MNYHIINENGERAINQEFDIDLDAMDAIDTLHDKKSKAVFITTARNKAEALAALERIREYIEKDL